MKLTGKSIFAVGFVAAFAVSAFAQPVISAKSGVVARAEGDVFIGDTAVENSSAVFPEVKENAILRTEAGRAEILLTRGVYMRVGEKASFKMFTNRLIDTRLEILTGSAIVEADEIVKDNNLTILAGEATVAINKHGLFRFDLATNSIKVFEGSASVAVNGETTVVGSGRLLRLENGKPVVEKFNKDDMDALDNWSKRRAEQLARANASSAKAIHDYGCNQLPDASNHFPVSNWAAATVPQTSPCYDPCNSFKHNSWYGVIVFVPCGANVHSPYGYRYWSPWNVMRAYYVPPPVYNRPSTGFGGGGFGGGFPSTPQTSGGYSGAMSSPSVSSVSSAPAAAATTGTTAASSAGTSSAGHGSAGGHGK